MQQLKTIWVVDDDPIFTFLTETQLNQLYNHLHIRSFANGDQAFKALKGAIDGNEEMPDLILLDINMPVMDGWEFVDEYKELMGKLKDNTFIFMVSSTIDINEIEMAKNHEDIKGFMSKPLVMEELIKMIEQGKPD